MQRLFWTIVLCLTGPVSTASALEVTTDPAPLALGKDVELATISIKGLPGQGPVRAAVNVGAIESINTEGAQGQVELRYRLPKERYPQVLCLAVWRRGSPGRVHVERIPMLGRAVITVRTRKRSQIIVAVGHRLFGPHDTGRKGRRRVRLLIPPGISKALVKVTDEMKLKTKKTIRIRTPRYNQLTLVTSPKRITAGRRDGKLRITAAAASTEHDAVDLEVQGQPHTLKRAAPGVWSGSWSAGEVPAGTISVKAWLPGDPKSVQQAQVEVAGPAVAAVKPTVTKVRRRPPTKDSISGGRRLRGIVAAGVGMIHNTGDFVSPRFSGELGLEYRLARFGWIGARLLIGVSWSSQQITAPGGLERAESSILLVPLGGGITYRYPLPLLTPYVTVDLLALLARSSATAEFMEDQTQTDVTVGILGMVGAERQLGPGRVFLQAGFQWGQVESAELKLLAGGVVVEAGYRFAL